jgi:CDP-diacylglycerol--serine O-phosphatidyltransferase
MGKTRFILPNAFTSMNFLLGAFSICWTTGAFAAKDPILMGAYFIILSVLFDKLDGFAARLVNASSEFGAQFDSLADLIAFGLAPSFSIIFAYKNLAPQFFDANVPLMAVAFSVYVLCAAMRLAKYNACDADSYHHHFSGVPTTFVGATNAILIVFLKNKGIFADTESFIIYVPVIILLITGFLMVAPLFLPKLQPRKNKAFNLFQAVLIVLTYIAGFLFFSEKMFLLEYLLVLVVSYLTIGLAIGLIQRNKIIEEAKAESDK